MATVRQKDRICYTVKVKKLENAKTLQAAPYNAVALCAVGAEKAVSNELKKLDLSVAESGFGKVRFRSDKAGLYKALMGLRAADRVLLEAGVFPAADFDALFKQTQAIPWEKLVPAHLGLKVVKVRTNRSQLKAETSIQSVVHKAAAQRLCKAYKLERLPDAERSLCVMAEVRVFIEKDIVSLLLDISGDPLFKRGYRTAGGAAPLRETTAAAMLLLSGWKRKYPLYDPFCGSGTILSEALLYAWGAAPGLGRRFAIKDLLIADDELEEAVRGELRGGIDFQRTIRIAGSDEDSDAVSLAAANLERAQVLAGGNLQNNQHALPAVRTLSMQEARPPFTNAGGEGDNSGGSRPSKNEPHGFIVTNPPYGKRLGDPSASEKLYAEMAVLAQNFPKWKLVVITSHPGFESFFGRKANSCREIKGGPIPAFFFQYELL